MSAPPPVAEPKKSNRGRKTKLTPELIKRALVHAKTLAPETVIAEALGLNPDTWFLWKRQGLEGSKLHSDFFRRFNEARGGGAITTLKLITKNRDWRAKAWALERTFPADFGRQRLELTGKEGGPIRLEGSGPAVLVVLEGAEGLDNPYAPPAPKPAGPDLPPPAAGT
jgi:hypothetical protein